MKKINTITSILIFLLLLAFGYWYFFIKNPQSGVQNRSTSSSTTYTIKPLPSPTIPSTSTVNLVTLGGNVQVINFFKTAQKIIEATVIMKQTDNYTIIYANDSNEFTIAINAHNSAQLDAFRQSAERDLTTMLGISQNDACKLVVHVQVPYAYDANLADKNLDYGLSFCPGSIPLGNYGTINSPSPTSLR